MHLSNEVLPAAEVPLSKRPFAFPPDVYDEPRIGRLAAWVRYV